MLAMIFFIVFVNISCTFLYLLFEREPKKKPVVEEELKYSRRSEHLKFSDIIYSEVLELIFSKKDGTTEAFFIFNCDYWVEKDYIILILPDSLEERISIILDKKQIHNYTNKNRKLLHKIAYDSFNSICTDPDVQFISVFNSSFEWHYKNEWEDDNVIINHSYKIPHVRWITGSEPVDSWEEDDKKFQNYLINKK